MIVIKTNNFLGFTRKEFWFYNDESIEEGSYNVFSAAKKVINSECNFIEKYNTVIVDLTKSEEELFKSIHATYRYDIKSAEKQNVRQVVILKPSVNECKELTHAYNLFATERKIAMWDENRVLNLKESNALIITHAILNDIVVCTHVYIFDKYHISLSASFHNVKQEETRIRGEANKFLHWQDIITFKKLDYKEYDFGGLNMDKLPGIGKFKMNFGGDIVENYRYIKTSKFTYWIIKLKKNLLKS